MKRSKVFSVIVLSLLLLVVTSCFTDSHTHRFGDWVITEQPTETTTGKAERSCNCIKTEKALVPALNDTETWTLTVKDSTCTEEGSKTYSSKYGEIVFKIEKTEHAPGNWVLTTMPTLTEGGKALGTCTCSVTEEKDVPALSDTTVWELIEDIPTSYNAAGSQTYNSIYGEVKIEIAKKVAPYDNKTYSTFTYDVGDDYDEYRFGTANVETAWNNQVLVLDANGSGVGLGHPFRGYVTIKMVNELTGQVEIITRTCEYDENGNPLYDAEGNLVFAEDASVSVSYGYVDFASGIIVSTFNTSYNNVNVWTPFEVGVDDSSTNASSWDQTIAIEYTYDGTKYSMLVHKNVVYFGVSFVNEKGEVLVAKDAAASKYVYVVDKDGNKLFGFVNNGTSLVIADGIEGTYTNGADTLSLSGYGTLTLNGVEGQYIIEENTSYTIGAYVEGEYFEVTLNDDLYTLVKPMVTITYDGLGKAEVDPVTANKNIAYTLATPTNAENTFKGWYYDKDLTQAVEETFIPKEDVKFYAKWKAKVVINLVGVLEGDVSTIYLGEGDIIGSALPTYGVEEAAGKVFRGWYLDSAFENSLPEAVEVTEADSGFIIYAKWEDLAPYYGTYKGTEVWSSESGNYANVTVTIDENGKISGKWTGIVVDYDPTTQKISWKTSATSSTVKYLWFDEESNTIATHYSSQTTIGSDFYIFGKYQTTNKIAAHYGVQAPEKPGSIRTGYYAHFINIMTKDGAKDIFIYNEHIYSNVSITDTAGKVLTTSEIKNSKSVVVKDAAGNIILAVASKGNSFSANTNTVLLDSYFGQYNFNDQLVSLDGTGVITVGEKTGTYEKVDGQNYEFDVYLEENSEYYELTLDGTNCTLVKPMVEISFVVGDSHTPIASFETNKNVVVTLPDGNDAGYVFNGYFLDQEFNTPVPTEFKPTTDTVIYAKYSNPAVLTIVYNNGQENSVVTYSVGDTVTIDRPEKDGFAFVNWHTNSELTDDSIWENGSIINVDTIVYAQWKEAPIYNRTYVVTEVELDDNSLTDKSSVYTRTNAKLVVDPYGFVPKSSYPFSSDAEIKNYNPTTNYLEVHMDSKVYFGYIDPLSKIIILNYATGLTADIKEVMFLNPYETSSINGKLLSSYWDNGKTRTFEYTYSGTTYTALVKDNQVYFGVAFKDAAGNKVSADTAYQAETLYIYDAENALIAKYGYDGTTMSALDGYEGTYTNGTDTLVVNGISKVTLNDKTGTYSVAESSTYTLDAYLDNVYYEVTLDKVAKTYTMNKPEVTVSFDAAGKAEVSSITVNKNIEIELPTPTNTDYVFRGWYLDAELTKAVSQNYIPTETLTLFAKWDKKVTITVVYGNGLENATLVYGEGDTIELVEPALTAGKVFNGWYSNAECTESYTPGTATADMNIYCAWKESHALYGTYVGPEVWGSTANGGTSYGGTGTTTLVVDETGKTTNAKNGTIEEYDPTTGSFYILVGSTKYYGAFDAESGVLVYNYSSNKNTLGNDQYILVRGATKATVSGKASSYWNSGLCRLTTLTVTYPTETKEINVFTYDTKLYVNVTFTSTSGNVTANNAYTQNDLKVFDKNGNLIAEFMKKDGGLVVKALDGYQGTYTVGSDTIILDGYGAGTFNGAQMTYSYKGNIFTVVTGDNTYSYEYNEETNSFTVKTFDILYGKSFSATFACPSYPWYDTHTFKISFDGLGTAKITYNCTDGGCWESYSKGVITYVISGTTVTVTSTTSTSTYTFVFEMNSATAPTQLTGVSSSVGEYDGGFASGTIFA